MCFLSMGKLFWGSSCPDFNGIQQLRQLKLFCLLLHLCVVCLRTGHFQGKPNSEPFAKTHLFCQCLDSLLRFRARMMLLMCMGVTLMRGSFKNQLFLLIWDSLLVSVVFFSCSSFLVSFESHVGMHRARNLEFRSLQHFVLGIPHPCKGVPMPKFFSVLPTCLRDKTQCFRWP